MNNAKRLLEKYVEGKDLDRYKILEDIYLPKAIVSFEIEADNIDFPTEIIGNVEIAKVLSADFNKKYDLIKTYYLSDDFFKMNTIVIRKQNWLVVMREKVSGAIRVGTGFYNWEFVNQKDSGFKITHHKIFIYAMLELPSESKDILYHLQDTIDYPWVENEKVLQALRPFADLKPIADYLKV